MFDITVSQKGHNGKPFSSQLAYTFTTADCLVRKPVATLIVLDLNGLSEQEYKGRYVCTNNGKCRKLSLVNVVSRGLSWEHLIFIVAKVGGIDAAVALDKLQMNGKTAYPLAIL